MSATGGRAFTLTAHQPLLDPCVRIRVEQAAGAPLEVDEAVTVFEDDRGEALHEMHVALLRIAECEDLEEAKALARTGATWG